MRRAWQSPMDRGACKESAMTVRTSLNYFSQLGSMRGTRGWGWGRGPKTKRQVPLQGGIRKQNIAQPHNVVCQQSTNGLWTQPTGMCYDHYYYFLFSLTIKEFTLILRQIIGSATRTVNETGLINIWTSGKQGVILYYLKLNILSVEEWYT